MNRQMSNYVKRAALVRAKATKSVVGKEFQRVLGTIRGLERMGDLGQLGSTSGDAASGTRDAVYALGQLYATVNMASTAGYRPEWNAILEAIRVARQKIQKAGTLTPDASKWQGLVRAAREDVARAYAYWSQAPSAMGRGKAARLKGYSKANPGTAAYQHLRDAGQAYETIYAQLAKSSDPAKQMLAVRIRKLIDLINDARRAATSLTSS